MVKINTGGSQEFEDIEWETEEMSMKTNDWKKKQLLCVSNAIHSSPNTFICIGGTHLESPKTLRFHVWHTARCERTRWIDGEYLPGQTLEFTTLETLRNDQWWPYYRLQNHSLIYPAYHSLLNKGSCNRIEKLQKSALKIIYGPNGSNDEQVKKAGDIEKLEDRGIEITKKFALKTAANNQF